MTAPPRHPVEETKLPLRHEYIPGYHKHQIKAFKTPPQLTCQSDSGTQLSAVNVSIHRRDAMPSSQPHSTLVLPQHILANPLDTLRRQTPLAALFALNARFVDQSVDIVSSRLLLLLPASTSVHHLRESVSWLCALS